MPGPDNPDYKVTVTGGKQPARYTLTFGSLLRGGALYTHPERETVRDGRSVGGTVTIESEETHTWRADGPIHLYNNGRGVISVRVNGGQPIPVGPTGSIDTSCPTEQKRTLALATLGGALVGGATGFVLGD